jgi:hypothetical protein
MLPSNIAKLLRKVGEPAVHTKKLPAQHDKIWVINEAHIEISLIASTRFEYEVIGERLARKLTDANLNCGLIIYTPVTFFDDGSGVKPVIHRSTLGVRDAWVKLSSLVPVDAYANRQGF